ncbi:MAG: protein tyrosine phosphatase (PTP) superfamily phosphohydrolase (DUF442 family) [Bacteriovoracaceae bacterium]|jgi:protein tyrosine phosphatase (PTP) superfamily phosphohydrolase (DUF442 family)
MASNRITDIPGLMHLWKVDNLYLAGQPSANSWEAIKALGVSKVINLRDESEMDFTGEVKVIKELGMEYEQFPIVKGGALLADNCERLSQMLNDTEPHFIHCGSANRVGGWLITYLTKHKGMDFEAAVEIAQENGLSNPGFIDQAEEILKNSN